MSQFMICTGLIKNIRLNDSIEVVRYCDFTEPMKNVAKELLGELKAEESWTIIDRATQQTDALFSKMQKELHNNIPFQDSCIGSFFTKCLDSIYELILWYSDDYKELPNFIDIKSFTDVIEEEIAESTCEVYGWYRKSD